MSHDTHVIDGVNKDVGLMSLAEAKQYYLDLAGDWQDPYGDPVVKEHRGVRVVRDDLIAGTKCRGGDLLLSRLPLAKYDSVVYVQPRVGLAGVSILSAARTYDMDVVLHMPASKRISHHQAVCIERGAKPLFTRIAAMPNLNKVAKEWAEENNGFFVPLGLKHPLVTAALVKTASKIREPEIVVVATSTGVLSRALQIAWPNAEFVSVCVSRNMKAGELGRATPISEPMEFLQEERPENRPPFDSVVTYDAKAWKYALMEKSVSPSKDVLFWNVGKEPELKDPTIFDRVNSQRDWSTKAT